MSDDSELRASLPMFLRRLSPPRAKDAGVFVLALLLGLGTAYGVERSSSEGRVLRGLALDDGTALSGWSLEDVAPLLERLQERLGGRQITLQLGEAKLQVEARQLGASYDIQELALRVTEWGRNGGELRRLGGWFLSLFRTERVVPRVRLDAELPELAEKWASKNLVAPREPHLGYSKRLIVEPGRAGETLDWEALSSALTKALESPGSTSVALDVPIHQRPLVVSQESFIEAKERAKLIFSGPLEVLGSGEDQRAVLRPAQLGEAIKSEVMAENGALRFVVDVDALRRHLAAFLRDVEKPALDAVFQFGKSGTPKIEPSQMGAVLDEETFRKSILKAGLSKNRTLRLPLTPEAPRLTTEDAEGLGVKGLVSSFTTRHPCCRPRVKNIHHAAERLHGTVLRPGEQFSLNDALGPRSKRAGYFKAPTIVRGKMKDVYGGGISQLATTLFNSVLRGGYQIVQRQPHSIYFSRYPEGHEATVSFPEPDLVFANDTKFGMVIQADYAPTYLRISVYGDNEGRITSVRKSKRYNIVQPPKEYEANDEMEPGESKRVRAGQLGWTVLVSRHVKLADGTSREQKREVVYQPRPELLRVHSCTIPKGEPGHTGIECPEPEREEREEELSEDVYYETSPGYDED